MAYQVSRDRFTTLRKSVPADLVVLEDNYDVHCTYCRGKKYKGAVAEILQ